MAGNNETKIGTTPKEEMEEEIITLTTDDGRSVDFSDVAHINYQGNLYYLMSPVELIPGMQDDEVFIFKVIRGENGDQFEMELDEKTCEAVYTEYEKLFDEESKKENKDLKKEEINNGRK